MLKVYDPWEYVFEEWQTQRINENLLYYARDLMETLEVFEEEELMDSLNRAINACTSLNISINKNFMHIYRNVENELVSDWKLSPLACYLLTININPANPNVARAQLFFAQKISNYVEI